MKAPLSFFLALFCFFLTAQPSPDFTIIEANSGQEYSLYADFLDQGKTVVIDVFFTSCPPCNTAAPYLEPLYQEWGAGFLDVEFIALSDKSFDSNEDVVAYQLTKGHSFLGAGYDGMGQDAANLFKSGTYGFWLGTPTYIVISPDGTVNYDVRGNSIQHTFQLLDEAIEATGAARARRATGKVLWNGNGVGQAKVFLEGYENLGVLTDDTGDFDVSPIILPQQEYVLKVNKDLHHENGVSAIDMILILKHILNIQRFDSPLQYIAADVNRSNDITMLDLIKIRKLILQIDDHFANNTAWRFIRGDATFAHPENPYAEFNTLETQGLSFSYEDDFSELRIIGVKIGDVNFSADPQQLVEIEDK